MELVKGEEESDGIDCRVSESVTLDIHLLEGNGVFTSGEEKGMKMGQLPEHSEVESPGTWRQKGEDS